MDCREAKRKLRKRVESLLGGDDVALREHLIHCPKCARLALAERLLVDDIEQVRGMHPPHSISIKQVREGIAIREKNCQNTNLGVQIMRQISNTVNKRPSLSIATAGMSILLLLSILVPVRMERSIGYEVAFAAPGSDLVLNEENAMTMLAALDMKNTSIEMRETDYGAEYIISTLEDSVQVQRLIAIIDSLGGLQVRSERRSSRPRNLTIWQLLSDDSESKTGSNPHEFYLNADSEFNLSDLDGKLGDNFVLWMPVGDRQNDSLAGILMNRQGGNTRIMMLGQEGRLEPDECGWHQFLNNSTLNTETPDGKQETFNLYEIEDVRRLEKMGYNFATMQFETPGQIPIPGMGPKLNRIKSNPSAEEIIIEYMIPQATEVKVKILDRQGLEICSLLDCMPLAGIHQVSWDGRDSDGNLVEAGIYLCRFTAGDFMETRELNFKR